MLGAAVGAAGYFLVFAAGTNMPLLMLTGGAMAVGGYVGTAEVQTAGALMTIRLLYSVIPGLMFLVIVIALNFYDLEKRLPELRAQKTE